MWSLLEPFRLGNLAKGDHKSLKRLCFVKSKRYKTRQRFGIGYSTLADSVI